MLCYAMIGYDSSGKEIGWKGVENIDIFGKDYDGYDVGDDDDDDGSGDDHDYYFFIRAVVVNTHTHTIRPTLPLHLSSFLSSRLRDGYQCADQLPPLEQAHSGMA